MPFHTGRAVKLHQKALTTKDSRRNGKLLPSKEQSCRSSIRHPGSMESTRNPNLKATVKTGTIRVRCLGTSLCAVLHAAGLHLLGPVEQEGHIQDPNGGPQAGAPQDSPCARPPPPHCQVLDTPPPLGMKQGNTAATKNPPRTSFPQPAPPPEDTVPEAPTGKPCL